MLWITADTHFWHEKGMIFFNRPYHNVKQMNLAMIRNWNRVVRKDDTIFHLGDFCVDTDSRARDIMKQLNGHKILVKGNHDRDKSRMLSIGFNEVYTPPIERYGAILTHFPKYLPGKVTINVGVDVNHFSPIPFPMRDDVILCGHIHNIWKVRQYHEQSSDDNRRVKRNW
jgi:calcineurin-like phosphoesterase family protein